MEINQILNNLFPKLKFEDQEYMVFEDNVRNKGISLHKHIYDVLDSYNENVVTYHELSHMIRYDKHIRKVLYKFLATFEEQLRANLINEYDYPISS